MPKTILVPFDSSDHAHRAIDYAGDLAAHYQAKVVLFHAIHYPYGRLPEELHRFAVSEHLDSPDETASMVRKLLEAAEDRARKAGAIDIVTDSREGDPAETILAAAKAVGADLIVMGSRGLGDLKGMLVGSVSHKVLHHADIPVTIVR